MKTTRFILALITGMVMSFALGGFLAHAAGAPELAVPLGAGFFALSFIPTGNAQGKLMSITVAAIVAEWGAYYRSQGQAAKDIQMRLLQKSETEAIFPRRITEQTIMEKAVAEISRVLQRFQKTFTPLGGVVFTPTKISLYKIKIDLAEYPDDLEESWLGFLADNDLDRTKWPFVKWYLDNVLLKAAEEFEKNEIYKGVPGTIVPGTPTGISQTILGIRKQLNDANTDGKSITLTLGAVPVDPVEFVAYMEEYAAMIADSNEALNSELNEFFMSHKLRRRFMTGMRTKYNMNYAQTDLVSVIDTNYKIVGLESHNGSDKIWTTPLWNRQMGIKKPGNESIFKVEGEDRKVKAWTDYYKGFGFWLPEYLVQNDVDLV